MNNNKKEKSGMLSRFKGGMTFAVAVVLIYIILLIILPEKTYTALKASLNILTNMLIALVLVYILLFLINLFMNPAKVAGLIGRTSGFKGIIFSVIAGIISAGPIYAWYPLLKDLKEKGAGYSPIVIFLYNRAVKPFLLPVMIAYFGGLFVLILTIFMIISSVLIGYSVDFFMKINQD